MDLPNTFDPNYYEALIESEHIFLVGRQDVPSMHAAKVIRDTLVGRGIKSFEFVINQFDNELANFSRKDVGELLQISSVASITSDHTGYRAAINEGRLLREVVPMSAAVTDVRSIAISLLEKSGIPTHLPHYGIWDRVKTLLSRMRN
jgi:Flp pilus assembly CpaE family ATPase